MQHSSVRLFIAAVGICLLASLPALASEPTDIPQVSSVFASPDLAHPLTNDRLALCITEAGRAMRLADREPPQIIVLQLSPAEALRLGMRTNVVLSNKDPARPNRFYEVWLVGPNGIADLALGVVSVFEVHFGVTLTPTDRAATVKRIIAHLGSTVDAKALRNSKIVDR